MRSIVRSIIQRIKIKNKKPKLRGPRGTRELDKEIDRIYKLDQDEDGTFS
jgi:hypothetical protein